ncbi:MAG TPA: FUSC family protein [Rudaea sp.]|nr:FUSC family protein [Rudaea sp.]
MATSKEALPEAAARQRWPQRLRRGMPDAARMFAAAMLAYALAQALQLHEAHWAVLSALVTGRAEAGGTARASMERLAATIAGAALAAAAALARSWHIDGAVLLFSVLAPLCLLVALKPAYRAAPIAALIVLSSGLIAGQGPLGTAILRTTEIAVGGLASVLVSFALFPRRGRVKPRQHAAVALHHLAAWVRLLASAEPAARQRGENLREKVRAELRELTVLARTSGWREDRNGDTARLTKLVMALQGDIGFVARALARKPLRTALTAIAGEFGAALAEIAARIDAIGLALDSGALPAADVPMPAYDAFCRAATNAPIAQFLLHSLAASVAQLDAAFAPGPPPQRDAPAAAT